MFGVRIKLFGRLFNWLKNLFKRKPEEEKIEEIIEEEEEVIIEEYTVDIEEYSPDVFEVGEEDQSLLEEEKDLERHVREMKREKEVVESVDELLDKISSGEDIFTSLGAEDFWNATGYCTTVQEKFSKALQEKDEEQQLKHFWRTNKMYMRSVEAYRDAIAQNDMLRARVMLLNIRMLY